MSQPFIMTKLNIIIMIFLVLLNFLLLSKNLTLQAKLDYALTYSQLGQMLNNVACTNLEGTPSDSLISLLKRRTLLILFSTECDICELNMTAWQTLIAWSDSSDIDYFFLTTADKSNAVKQKFPEWNPNKILLVESNQIKVFPQTLLVDGDGHVDYLRVGQFKDRHMELLKKMMLQQ
jgi:hypothetical protein